MFFNCLFVALKKKGGAHPEKFACVLHCHIKLAFFLTVYAGGLAGSVYCV